MCMFPTSFMMQFLILCSLFPAQGLPPRRRDVDNGRFESKGAEHVLLLLFRQLIDPTQIHKPPRSLTSSEPTYDANAVVQCFVWEKRKTDEILCCYCLCTIDYSIGITSMN